MKKLSWVAWVAIIIITIAGGGTVYFVHQQSLKPVETTAPEQTLPFTEQFNTIIIGWDGVQRDHFYKCYNKELPECANGLPNIKELSSDQIHNLTITNGATSTKPGWVQVLTGYNAEVTGITTNDNYAPIPEGYTIFEKVANKYSDVKTIFLAAKIDNLGGTCKNEKTAEGVVELKGEPWCNVKNKLSYFQNGLKENETTGNKTLEMIDKYKNDRFLLFVHFAEPDSVGHAYGENSAEYSNGMIDDDVWLGKITAKLKELNLQGKTMIYVATDHGFDQNGKSHNNAPYSIYATNDQSVVRTADRRDITPTILKKYSVSLEKNGIIPAVNGTSLDIIQTACIKEGESYIDYNDAPRCCSGLKILNLDLVSSDGKITLATGGAGDKSGICVK